MARARWFETFSVPGLWKRPPLSDRHALAATTRVTLPDTTGEERGASGTLINSGIISGEDYNPKLDGRNGLQVYDKMRRSNGQVAATLLAPKLPLKSARWRVDPVKNGDATDQAIADFCHACLFEQGSMLDTWSYVLDHLLLRLDFGTTVCEKVWVLAPDNTLRLARLAPRLPHTIYRWNMDPQTGRLAEVVQYAVKNGVFGQWTIPAEYAVISVHQREGDNFWGRSLLRPAHMHWFYVQEFYRIAAIKWDRYGVGIPYAVTDDSTANDTASIRKIEKTLQNLRSNSAAWFRTTPKVEYKILTPSGGEGGAIGMKDDIEHHNAMIPRSILAGFLAQGEQRHGSFGLGQKLSDFFTNALQALADDICADITQQVIADLCAFNFNMKNRKTPAVHALNVSDVDLPELSDAMQKLGTFITPEDGLENVLRAMMNLPPLPSNLLGRERKPPIPPPPGSPAPLPPPADIGTMRAFKAWTNPTTGASYGRAPTLLEMAIFSVRDVPVTLNKQTAALATAMADVRRRQLTAVVAELVQKDARATGPFTDIRPGQIGLPYVADLEAAIKAAQTTTAAYGAQQVDLELRRQGLTLRGRPSFDWGHYDAYRARIRHFAPARAMVLDSMTDPPADPIPVGADTNKRVAKSALVASAQITAERMSDAWYGRILEVGLQERRAGTQGADLSQAIQDRLLPEVDQSVLGDARAEINEAFAVGRATEAQAQSDQIDVAEYSALMDASTCAVCAAADGEQVAFGSARYYELLPPNVACEGNRGRTDACRCVFLFLFKDRTA